jgi:hypothetical protein
MFKGKTAAEIRQIISDLKKRQAEKLAELKDDTPADAARRIEAEHDAIVAQVEEGQRALTAAEAEEAARAAAPTPAETERAATPMSAAAAMALLRRAEFFSERALAEQMIERSETEDAIMAAVMEAHRVKSQNKVQIGGPRAEITRDEGDTKRDGMAEYIIARSNLPGTKMTERAAEYRGMRATDLIRETIRWRGESSRGLTDPEIAERGLMSTSDFPLILAAVANKVLRQTYEAAPRTFRPWTRALTLPNFNTYHIVRRGETPQLEEINEHGEFTTGTIKESKETITLKEYGRVVGMTRRMLINDDLGAFVGIPADFAQSAATLESDLVYYQLLSNPTMNEDSTALFHADHNNVSGSGTAIDITPLSAMRARMAKQLGTDKETVLQIMANYLLVPPELETRAEQLLASFIPNENAKVNPEWIRSLTPISEARLSLGASKHDKANTRANGSGTAYYLASSGVDTIVTATLVGQAGPYTESKIGFEVDGVKIKCRHDFAAAPADFRGLQKDAGA